MGYCRLKPIVPDYLQVGMDVAEFHENSREPRVELMVDHMDHMLSLEHTERLIADLQFAVMMLKRADLRIVSADKSEGK